MISPLLRFLLMGVLMTGGVAGGARADHPAAAQPTSPLTRTTLLTTPPGTPPATPPATLSGTACHRNSFSNSRLFPETGYAVSGEFINYWERNGDLSQQGYPISAVIEELSDLDGKRYTVQYFERAVFECHPENLGSQFAVLLAQLGTFQYRQKYPQGAPGQIPNGERPRFFAETGHTLGGEFRTYWEEHGGKYQQGLPLSDEFSEVSPLDGKRYTVQYFERAVFEYHPENAPPYRVLLSQLGTLRYRAKYPAPPGPPSVALPAPDPSGPQFLGYTSNFSCGQPSTSPLAAGGAYLFWRDTNSPYQESILGYDANAQRQLSAAQTRDIRSGLVTDGRSLAWYGARRDQASGEIREDGYIHGYNLQTGREFPPLRVPEGMIGGLAVGDDTLYYLLEGAVHGVESELYAYHWATGQTTRIATAPADSSFWAVAAGNGYVAWLEQDARQDELRLYLAPARNPAGATVISTGSLTQGLGSFVIAGDHVLWTQADGSSNTTTGVEVRMYTISTRTTQVLDRGGWVHFSASENRVAWLVPSSSDYVNNVSSPARAVVLDLSTGLQRSYELPAGVGDCATLAGSALAYIQAISGSSRSELYLQPLP